MCVIRVIRRRRAGFGGECGGAVRSLNEPSRRILGTSPGRLRRGCTRLGRGGVGGLELRGGGGDFGVEAVDGGFRGFFKVDRHGALLSLLHGDYGQLGVHVRALRHGGVEGDQECLGLGGELPFGFLPRREQGIPLGDFSSGVGQLSLELEPLRLSLRRSLGRGDLLSLERLLRLVRALTLGDDLRLGHLRPLVQGLHLGVLPRERRRRLLRLGL